MDISSLHKHAHHKLASQFYGPFKIEQKLGKVAYKLSLPLEAKIHPVFHVSLLKKFVGTPLPATVELPPLSDEGFIQIEPEKILDVCWIKQGSKFLQEYLVKWKQLPIEDATWETTMLLQKQFPALNLENKVPPGRESIDRPRRSLRPPKKNPKFLD
ncbi:PREDICTED: uncharacterized protein LOC104589534 [Nelumbo nucifera]|uniref:Uncharacterized protein LOC104589534 n=1 Tax=Nelumbo nucifera TaxID=4432 RepID=A0A1U7Z5R8_NELNU|nr:PREDICTED: uncharacterized protein LOC104589534 [Nelumbo nucifera]